MYKRNVSKFIVYTAKPRTRYKEAVLALENVCPSFLQSKDMEEVCIGQIIVNITHQLARQTPLLDYFTH